MVEWVSQCQKMRMSEHSIDNTNAYESVWLMTPAIMYNRYDLPGAQCLLLQATCDVM